MKDSTQQSELAQLFSRVVDGGYCIGCGACASVPQSPIRMAVNNLSMIQPSIDQQANDGRLQLHILAVCPFSGVGPNEDDLGRELFGHHCKPYDNKIGYSIASYAGHVCERPYREQGSSSGLASWVLVELLRRKLIDAVIHVQAKTPDSLDPRLFYYRVSMNEEQVRAGAKSRYYPVEMSQVMTFARNNPGRYAFVGIPCFVKAARLLSSQNPILAQRIAFSIAIFCGHLKSTAFAECLAWQCGVEPGNLESIDFRKKLSGRDAIDYGIEIRRIGADPSDKIVQPMSELHGKDWGLGYFKYSACDYCDDVVGETADISIGDAWLPQYIHDSQGTNIAVVRHPVLHDLIERGISDGRLHLDPITPEVVFQSQEAGFRHRRDGLAYRLWLKDQKGGWRPPKRVTPRSDHLPSSQKKIFRLRSMIAAKSHLAFLQAKERRDFALFVRLMNPLVRRYRRAYRPLWKVVASGILRRIRSACQRSSKGS